MLEKQTETKSLTRGFEAKAAGPLLLAAGALAFAITLIASRGAHSKQHERTAQLAYLPETLIIAAGFGLMKSKNNEPLKRFSRRAATIGSVGTVLCYATVFATDRPFSNFMQSAKSKDDLNNLAGELRGVFKRHMVEGVKSLHSTG